VATHTYWPFGREAAGSEVDFEPMRYTGHERDFAGTGNVNDLDYMHARYYTPVAGRFISVDPRSGEALLPATWNRYTYASNDPMLRVDRNGRADVRTPLDKLILETPSVLARTAELVAKTNYGASQLSARREQGFIIAGQNGQYAAGPVFTSNKSNDVDFTFTKIGNSYFTPSGEPIAATMHSHPGTGFEMLPGGKIITIGSGASQNDKNLAAVTQAPVYIVQGTDSLIKYENGKQTSILTNADFSAYLQRAADEYARQQQQLREIQQAILMLLDSLRY
jgi:RHS repeat-associated protein